MKECIISDLPVIRKATSIALHPLCYIPLLKPYDKAGYQAPPSHVNVGNSSSIGLLFTLFGLDKADSLGGSSVCRGLG